MESEPNIEGFRLANRSQTIPLTLCVVSKPQSPQKTSATENVNITAYWSTACFLNVGGLLYADNVVIYFTNVQ